MHHQSHKPENPCIRTDTRNEYRRTLTSYHPPRRPTSPGGASSGP